MMTGARVRNAYATYPQLEDSPEKFGLILHNAGTTWYYLLKIYWLWMGMRLIR